MTSSVESVLRELGLQLQYLGSDRVRPRVVVVVKSDREPILPYRDIGLEFRSVCLPLDRAHVFTCPRRPSGAECVPSQDDGPPSYDSDADRCDASRYPFPPRELDAWQSEDAQPGGEREPQQGQSPADPILSPHARTLSGAS